MRKRRTRKGAEIIHLRVKKLVENGFTYKDISRILKLKNQQLVYYYYRIYPQGRLQDIKNNIK